MTITGIISAVIIGLVIGALGRLVVPGRQPIPIWLTIVIGIVAAFIGGFVAGALGYANANGGIPWVLLIIQIVIAAIGVVIAANLYTAAAAPAPDGRVTSRRMITCVEALLAPGAVALVL